MVYESTHDVFGQGKKPDAPSATAPVAMDGITEGVANGNGADN